MWAQIEQVSESLKSFSKRRIHFVAPQVFYSVTRLCDFWIFLATKFLTKVAQLFSDFMGYFENHNFQTTTVVAGHIWSPFWKFWATFNFTSGHAGLLPNYSVQRKQLSCEILSNTKRPKNFPWTWRGENSLATQVVSVSWSAQEIKSIALLWAKRNSLLWRWKVECC